MSQSMAYLYCRIYRALVVAAFQQDGLEVRMHTQHTISNTITVTFAGHMPG